MEENDDGNETEIMKDKGEEEEENKCSICFDPMHYYKDVTMGTGHHIDVGNTNNKYINFNLTTCGVFKLECNHMFHSRCVFKWILRYNTCPLCRSPAIKTTTPLMIIIYYILSLVYRIMSIINRIPSFILLCAMVYIGGEKDIYYMATGFIGMQLIYAAIIVASFFITTTYIFYKFIVM